MTNNTPDYDNLYFEEKKMSETVTIEKQVWETTLNHSMVLEADNKRLKQQLAIAVEALNWYDRLEKMLIAGKLQQVKKEEQQKKLFVKLRK